MTARLDCLFGKGCLRVMNRMTQSVLWLSVKSAADFNDDAKSSAHIA